MSTDLTPTRAHFTLTSIERRVFEQHPDLGAQLTERSGKPVVLIRAEAPEQFAAWCSPAPSRFEIALVRTKFGAVLQWTIIHYVSLDFGVAVALFLSVETDANRQAQDSLDGVSELPVYIFDQFNDNPHLLPLPLSDETRTQARTLYQEAVNYQATLTQTDKQQARKIAIQQSWQGQWIDAVEPTYFLPAARLLLELSAQDGQPEAHYSIIRRRLGGSLKQITAVAKRVHRLTGLARSGQLLAWGVSANRDQHFEQTAPDALLNVTAVLPCRDMPPPDFWPELKDMTPDQVPASLQVATRPTSAVTNAPAYHEEMLYQVDQARLRLLFIGPDAPAQANEQQALFIERLMRRDFLWSMHKADKRVAEHPKGWLVLRGIQANDVGEPELILELLHPASTSVLDALRLLEEDQHKRGRPLAIALACALLAAERSLERLSGCERAAERTTLIVRLAVGVGYHFRNYKNQENLLETALDPSAVASPSLNRAQLDLLAESDDPPDLKTSVDTARFVLARARACWLAQNLLARSSQSGSGVYSLANTAAIELLLRPNPILTVSGVDLRVSLRAAPLAWLSASALQGITAEVLQTLLPDGELPPRKITAIWLTDEQRHMLRGIASSLLRLADEQAVYAPAGYFHVKLPTDLTPLRATGLTSLKVVAGADGLWVKLCGTLNDQGIFHWTPTGLIDPFLSGDFATAVHACLSALWHDLRVSAEAVQPDSEPSDLSLSRVEVEAHSNDASQAAAKTRTRRGSTVRILPRLRITGEVIWGTLQEQQLARQIYNRVGHRRRLHDPTWQRRSTAATEAAVWGVILPDGYTWVRRLDRPRPASDSPAAPIRVTARGLVSLLAIIQDTDFQPHEGERGI